MTESKRRKSHRVKNKKDAVKICDMRKREKLKRKRKTRKRDYKVLTRTK